MPRLRLLLLLLWHHGLLWSPGRSAEQCSKARVIGKGRIGGESRVRVAALQRYLLLLLLIGRLLRLLTGCTTQQSCKIGRDWLLELRDVLLRRLRRLAHCTKELL